eukprot:m.49748 g.49748  ORF g.49748 m.49748 type:complete len:663 (+) comp11118_c0_seq2:97-2085(+)
MASSSGFDLSGSTSTVDSSLWQWGDAGGADGEDSGYGQGGDSFDETSFKGGRDAVIFLIDCSPSMFEEFELRTETATGGDSDGEGGDDEDGEGSTTSTTYFSQAVKATHAAFQNKILTSDRDLVSVVFYSTVKRKKPEDADTVYVLSELDLPSAEQIQNLEEIADGRFDFEGAIGSSDDYSLKNALWTCSNLFASVRQRIETKRILLFTNNDNPHLTQDDARKQASTQARDLVDMGIDIDLLHMSKPGQSFDLKLFYKPYIVNTEEEVEGNASQTFEQLLRRTRVKCSSKRARMTIPWTITGGFDIGVRVYNLIGTATKASYIRLDGKSNREVATKTRYYCSETSAPLLSTDMKSTYTYGGEKVVFEKAEVDAMRSFGKPGLLLMGFKPSSALRKEYNVKKSSFIYPDESIVRGSTRAFTAFLDSCLRLDKVPICRLISRTNSPPDFVALLPQAEVLDEESKVQTMPPGFHMIVLPFADDMRQIKHDKLDFEIDPEEVEAAQKLIKSMTFKAFSSDNFTNPTLQKHFAALEALALDKDAPDEVVDLTVVTDFPSKVHKRAQAMNAKLYDPIGYNPESATGAKRKPASSGGAKRAKAGAAGAAAGAGDAGIDEAQVKALYDNGQVSKLKVADLKAFLKLKKQQLQGTRKAELVAQVEQYFDLL